MQMSATSYLPAASRHNLAGVPGAAFFQSVSELMTSRKANLRKSGIKWKIRDKVGSGSLDWAGPVKRGPHHACRIRQT